MPNLLQSLRQRSGNTMMGRWVGGRAPTPPPAPFKEMGVSGTAVHGGYVQVKERSPNWTGRQKWVTASDLAVNTAIAAASVHYFLNLVAYPSWSFRPHDENDEESLALAEFAEDVLNNMTTPWYKVVRRAAMYRFHGFGLQEWTAKHRKDGLVGFKDIEARPQHTIEQWDVDDNGSVLGVWQRSPQTGAMLGLPRDKLLYLVEDTLTDNPEGIGVFRHMADSYNRLNQLQVLEIRAYERDLRGTPIARAPLTMLNRAVASNVITQGEANRIVQEFESLVTLQVKQSDTGIVMDSLPYFSDSDAGAQVSGVPQWGFELLSGAGVGHSEIAAAIDRIQREIARLVGTEHLMMGDQGGNRALGEDKSRNLYLIANSVLKYVAAQVKSDILVPLWRLNGFPLDKMPEAKPEDVTFKNAEAITNALGKMASAGAVLSPNDPVINDVRDLLGVERVPDDIMAQGATPQNPALAGLPPHLQAAMMGGKGPPGMGGFPGVGGPPGAGGPGGGMFPGAGPGKMPGGGGGAMPGEGGEDPFKAKKFKKRPPFEDEDNDGEAGSSELPEAGDDELDGGEDVRPGATVTPQGQEADSVASGAKPAEGSDTTTIDVNGPKPGGNVEVSTDLLVRVLDRLTGGNAVAGQAGAQGTTDKPSAGGDSRGPVDPKVEAEAGARGAAPDDKVPGGSERLPKEQDEQLLPAEEGRNPEAAAAAKPPVGEQGEGKPQGDAGNPFAGASGAGKQPAGAEKPAAQPQAGSKDPIAAAQGVDPKAEPGAEAAAAGKAPEGLDPNAPLGQPPVPGQAPGMPGAPQAPPKPEMTPEIASEVLQPYADPSAVPEDKHPQTEGDALWVRLGEEKDVDGDGVPGAAPAGNGDPEVEELKDTLGIKGEDPNAEDNPEEEEEAAVGQPGGARTFSEALNGFKAPVGAEAAQKPQAGREESVSGEVSEQPKPVARERLEPGVKPKPRVPSQLPVGVKPKDKLKSKPIRRERL